MSYAVPVNSIMEVCFEFQHNLQYVQSLFHYRFTSGSAITDGRAALVNMASVIQGAGILYPRYIACISDELTGGRIYTQWIKPTRFSQVTTIPTIEEGQVAGGAFPQNVAAAITKETDIASRHGRGTLHMPGVPLAWVVSGELTLVAKASYTTLGADLKDAIVLGTGQTMTPVIYNRADYTLSIPITNGVVQATSRVMRRRTVGVGI